MRGMGDPASLSALNRQGWVTGLPAPPPSFPPSRRPDKLLLSEGQLSACGVGHLWLRPRPTCVSSWIWPCFSKMGLGPSVLEAPSVLP